ncbi:hypothetical protein NE236_02425 [Actinoallomurus purpureus]|uniref:hypothetical protein n=1 Tax=Actinoallomurus purpureus TaxID=478114 RepID=UPI0020923237|nr:hypothetical protein [Actinoallomurus purpureus]MCO6003825.1 hypothetical protein [Actinoallomurus purpureus]
MLVNLLFGSASLVFIWPVSPERNGAERQCWKAGHREDPRSEESLETRTSGAQTNTRRGGPAIRSAASTSAGAIHTQWCDQQTGHRAGHDSGRRDSARSSLGTTRVPNGTPPP